jgi:hypothetical protein
MNNTTAIVSLAALAGAAWFFTRPQEGDDPTKPPERSNLGAWATPETFPYTTQEAHPDLLPEGTEDWLSFSIWRRKFKTEDGETRAFRIHVGPKSEQFSVRMTGGAMASPAVSKAGKNLPFAVFPEIADALEAVAAYMEQYQDEMAAMNG